ncbi:MAG: ATP-binding protein [Saprospiraceae bacterium]|nr:ATP-binding protein [Saprospiraceae bacterium]
MEIARTILKDLQAHLSAPEITLLIGPRQAGKTTLLRELRTQLEKEGELCFFFNLDIDSEAIFFQSQQKFVAHIQAISGGQKSYIFIDEVQRIADAGLFLKGLYDRQMPYKFIVTGSGSLELKERIAESLVGRKQNFFLPTVSVQEWVQYATEYRFGDRISAVIHTDELLEERLLNTYMTYGGYPRVITSPTIPLKNNILQEIYQGYIERDIGQLLQLEKSSAFVVLLQLLANRSGQLVNYSDLSKLTGLSVATLKNYLWYSEKTFVTESVTPFFRNKEKEVTKAPQYYFWDLGLRNYLRGIFEDISDQGNRFQIFAFRLLEDHFRNSVASLHYWRTQNQAEVDFVINLGHRVLPVEIKSAKMKKPELSRSFQSFLSKYNPPEAWIINRHLRADILSGETKVRFIPWYDLI